MSQQLNEQEILLYQFILIVSSVGSEVNVHIMISFGSRDSDSVMYSDVSYIFFLSLEQLNCFSTRKKILLLK